MGSKGKESFQRPLSFLKGYTHLSAPSSAHPISLQLLCCLWLSARVIVEALS
ncbi:hypothetical protein L208DRAFT_1393776 [Tricholoma matsutake]|nr:hypothetical protein L208DRAFT_1393776 [Tricholoma matsutake 945]